MLLDTHVWLWCLANKTRVPQPVAQLISNADRVCVSAISVWELAIKIQIGKLHVSRSLSELFADPAFEIIPFGLGEALAVKDLSQHHKDPFDRAILAQAIHGGLALVTSDAKLKLYEKEARMIFC